MIILIALALTRGLIYLSLFPPWVAPDEPAHFEVIRIIGQEGEIPSYSYFETNPVNFELSQSFQTFRMWELLERPTPPANLLSESNLPYIPFIYYPYPGSLVTADAHPILPYILLAPVSYMVGIYDIATELYILSTGNLYLFGELEVHTPPTAEDSGDNSPPLTTNDDNLLHRIYLPIIINYSDQNGIHPEDIGFRLHYRGLLWPTAHVFITRLTANKPYIWGQAWYYEGLVIVYAILLLGLFYIARKTIQLDQK